MRVKDKPLIPPPKAAVELRCRIKVDGEEVAQSRHVIQAGAGIGRYVGGGVVTRDFIASKPDVPITDPINAKNRLYIDLSGEVGLFSVGAEGKVSLYGAIQNLFNTDPPVTGYDGYGAPRQLFDLIGRQYNIGVRVTL